MGESALSTQAYSIVIRTAPCYKLASNWILTSCQPHRVTSGQSNSIRSTIQHQSVSSLVFGIITQQKSVFGERLVCILFSLDLIRANMFHMTYAKGQQFCCALTPSPFPRRRIRPRRPVHTHTHKIPDVSVKTPDSAQSLSSVVQSNGIYTGNEIGNKDCYRSKTTSKHKNTGSVLSY